MYVRATSPSQRRESSLVIGANMQRMEKKKKVFRQHIFAFQNAVMTFEEEKMVLALATLRATEKRCATSSSYSPSLLTSSPSFSSFQNLVKYRLVQDVWSDASSTSTSPTVSKKFLSPPIGKEKKVVPIVFIDVCKESKSQRSYFPLQRAKRTNQGNNKRFHSRSTYLPTLFTKLLGMLTLP